MDSLELLYGHNCRHSINWFGFRGALLVHSACISTTLLAATTFRLAPPIDWLKYWILRPLVGAGKSEEEIGKKVDEGGFLVCGKFWLPSLGQIFVGKVLTNPLFLLLTFSVVTGRTAMRAFGMLVPAFGESLGLGKETSTYLLTIMAIADFISRYINTNWNLVIEVKSAEKNWEKVFEAENLQILLAPCNCPTLAKREEEMAFRRFHPWDGHCCRSLW